MKLIIELVKYTGDEHTVLTELEKGALFGEMAIIDNKGASASCLAKTECVLRIVTEEEPDPQVHQRLSRDDARLASYGAPKRGLTRDAFAEVAEDNNPDTTKEPC